MKFKLEGYSKSIFKSRYAYTDDETWEQACQRVAKQMAMAEDPDKYQRYYDKFYKALVNNYFCPGGRIWYNSGRPHPQLLNCFVLENQLDSKEGWGTLSKEMIITSMTGGGCGIDFSDVRPRGAEIKGQRGDCPGPVELMRLINGNGKPVKAGGHRRVALMFSLDLDHPSLEEFLDAKLVKGELDLANVSVKSKKTSDFIKAVKEDGDWELSWKGKYKKTIKARDVWNRIVKNAYESAEPGFLNWELAEKESNISYIEELVTTNPCGEIGMSSHDACDLGHLVLPRFIEDGTIDWHLLASVVRVGVRFLDNVLSVNSFPLPEMKEKTSRLRRIGLGTTGLADMLAILGYKYGSEESIKFIDKLFRFISKAAYEASVMLAIEKGPFPDCKPDLHIKSGYMKRMPKKIKDLVEEHGIRNCALLTQAPTGTTSILSGNVSSGIEPMFAPAYERRYWDKDKRKSELIFHPLFKHFLDNNKDVTHFVGSRDISVRDHMEVQKVVQKHIDNAVSKCIAAGSYIPTSKGFFKIEDLTDNNKVDSFMPIENDIFVKDKNGDMQKITQHYNGGFKKTKKILLNNGAELEATLVHKLMTEKGWKKISELEEGDLIACRRDFVEMGNGSKEINFVDNFKSNSKKISTPKNMSKSLAKWLGMISADGSTVISSGAVQLTEKDPQVAKLFDKLTFQLFNIYPKEIIDKRSQVHNRVITSRNLVRFVEHLIGKGCRDKTIPEEILQGSFEEQEAFLEGLTLDGYVHRGKLVVYAGYSKNLRDKAAMILRNLGNIVYEGDKSVNDHNTTYLVQISEGPTVLNTPEKHKRLQSNGKVKKLVKVPEEVFKLKLETSHPEYSNLRYLKQVKPLVCWDNILEKLGITYDKDIYFQKITKIEDSESFVYDIEVESSHNYIINGIISHNTINLPEDYPVEDMSKVWLEYLPYLKGTTFYRENSRGYVDDQGNIQEPPLVALSLEEAKKRYDKNSKTGSEVDCNSGSCDI